MANLHGKAKIRTIENTKCVNWCTHEELNLKPADP
jgi:hypothetical protein